MKGAMKPNYKISTIGISGERGLGFPVTFSMVLAPLLFLPIFQDRKSYREFVG